MVIATDMINRTGREVTLTFPDGTKGTGRCVIRPLRYRNKMYIEGVGTDLGREEDSYFEMFAPPGFIPPGDLADHLLADGHSGSYAFIRRDTVYKGDAPVYDWAVLIRRTGGACIVVQPLSELCVPGGSCVFSVTADDPYAGYQWQVSYDFGISWIDVEGADGSELAADATAEALTGLYRCAVTNAFGTVFTNVVRMIPVYAPPVITLPPADVTAAVGERIAFRVKAAGAGTFRWQSSGDNGSTWTDIKTERSPGDERVSPLSLDADRDAAAKSYRCEISNPAGTVDSGSVMITLSDSAPVIMAQPEDFEGRFGDKAYFYVIANGAEEYEWQASVDGTNWNRSGSASAATRRLAVNVAAGTVNAMYRCLVSNAHGTTVSDVVRIMIKEE